MPTYKNELLWFAAGMRERSDNATNKGYGIMVILTLITI